MKKILLTIGLAALLAGIAQAQTVTNETLLDKVISDLGGATNYAVEPYATYAPNAPTKWGGGLLAVYNVNQYVGVGLGLDWLGEFSLVSGNVTLSLPFHPLSAYPSLVLTPFVLAGIATPYSGDGKFNGTAATVEDAGAYLKFGHVLGGQFNVGGCYGEWTGTGPYDVKRYHLFAGWSHGF
jgi:hypothetical protein